MSIMELFQDEGYLYLNGEQIHRERSEVLLTDDLRQYLLNRYAKDGLTATEVDGILLRLKSISGTIYEANKSFCKLLCDGFIFNREDRTQKDLYIQLVDYDHPENNVFKIVNQFEIEGVGGQLRIPDGIVFLNGIPVVVLEFKSAVKENTTIMDAYTQLTVRYRRDIPELFKYNAFLVISDGANNKYGSFFAPYDFFYAWRKIEADDKELDGISSLVTMVSGLFRKERLLAVLKDFIYFPDSSDRDTKIVCRYPQYFAATKLFENIKKHLKPEGDGKGGTYFGATGCGKSYTMLFLTEKDYIHFYCAVRSILFKLTKGDTPDISQMNARVRELLEGAIQSDGIEELFETGKHISVDIFSDEYIEKINAIQLPNTKIKVLQRLLSQAIDEYKKVNRIMGMEFSERLKRVVDEYNNRRRDEAFANEVLDDVAEQLAKLLEELKLEKDSFKAMGIDYEEKAFYDILKAVAKKYEFEYPDDKMIELSKRIKLIVDDKAKYTDWSTREDIKATLQVDLILLLDEFDYPPVTIDDVYKEVLEQAENFKKYAS